MASPLLQTALYPSESEVNMKDVDMIYPSLKSRHKQEEHPDHRVQKCSQGLLFWGHKRRKLFLLKDQESFCFLIYNLDRGLSNFHVLPGRCFVSARFCVLPLLFNTSCFSVLIFLHFWVLEFWREQGQSEGIQNTEEYWLVSEWLQRASSSRLCCWPAVRVREAVLSEILFSFCAL